MRFDPETIIITVLTFFIALPFHEFSHAFVAWKLGDPTAKYAGRLTLNPFKHLDPLGLMMVLAARIGWAKPVPINTSYFSNRRKGMILVSLAGPLSNLLLSFVLMIVTGIIIKLAKTGIINMGPGGAETLVTSIVDYLLIFVWVNISLAVFNMIPVPPLDGSRLISAFIPEESYFRFARYEQYVGIAFLILVIALPNTLGSVIRFFVEPVFNSMFSFISLLFGLGR